MLRVTTSPSPIQFYQDEVAVPLRFTLRDADGELVDTTYRAFTLIVAFDGESEFPLDPTGEPGELEYITEAGAFNTGGDPTKRLSAYITMDADYPYDEVWISDEFPIYVVAAPTENL